MRSPREHLEALQQRYAPDQRRPLGGYLWALSAFVGTVGALSWALAKQGGPPERLPGRDLAMGAVASFRLARLLTGASVTAPLRAPVTRFVGPAAPGEVREEVRAPEGGHAHALAELATCPYCLGTWTATGLGFGFALVPRWTRLGAAILTMDAAGDLLQKLYTELQSR